MTNTDWDVRERIATVAELHDVVPEPRRQVWLCHPTDHAVVLGSAQAMEVDPARAAALGVEVVRRRSGGAAVLVDSTTLVWIDLVIPAGDPLWNDDVGRAGWWVGDVWAGALGRLGVTARVHTGAMQRSPWSDLVCFAGIGPGEVVDIDGVKLVGLSQRRTREWARFQTAALVRWDPAPLVELLVPPERRPDALVALGSMARVVDASIDTLEQVFLDELGI